MDIEDLRHKTEKISTESRMVKCNRACRRALAKRFPMIPITTINTGKVAASVAGVKKTIRAMTAAMALTMSVIAPFGVANASDGQEASSSIVQTGAMPSHDIVTNEGSSADEENKQSVKSRAKMLAAGLIARATAVEPGVTADMCALETDGASLQGLERRIKSIDSLSRKIASQAEEKSESLETAANSITDVLRYTLATPENAYAEAVPRAIIHLADKGYAVEKFKNAWGGKFYQGINVHLASPAGVKVEVQFHTPQSYEIKTVSHEVYEIRRSPTATPEMMADAVEQSIAYNAQVIIPPGAKEVACPVALSA